MTSPGATPGALQRLLHPAAKPIGIGHRQQPATVEILEADHLASWPADDRWRGTPRRAPRRPIAHRGRDAGPAGSPGRNPPTAPAPTARRSRRRAPGHGSGAAASRDPGPPARAGTKPAASAGIAARLSTGSAPAPIAAARCADVLQAQQQPLDLGVEQDALRGRADARAVASKTGDSRRRPRDPGSAA